MIGERENGFLDPGAFQAFTDGMMEKHGAPGVCVGMIHKGEVVYLKGFGYRNLEEKLPVTEKHSIWSSVCNQVFHSLGNKPSLREGSGIYRRACKQVSSQL